MMRTFLLGCLFFSLATMSTLSQEAIASSGNNTAGNNGTVSYTIGQIFYKTDTGLNGIISQGVQQASEISVITKNKEKMLIDFSIYPNPTSDMLILDIPDNCADPAYQIYDVHGSLLENKKAVAGKNKINMNAYSKGIYYLKVENKLSINETYKILKK